MNRHIKTSREFDATPYRRLCTDCGVSRTKNPGQCATACQFIKPDYETAEQRVHGRSRTRAKNPDELYFGVVHSMYRASLKNPSTGAQWTGITTRLAELALRQGLVDAVLTVGPDPEDRWKPIPLVITDPADIPKARGMRIGYAPILKELDSIRMDGHQRLAVIGIPCQTYALRALEKTLKLKEVYVIGTPCSDNTTTENFHQFLRALGHKPEDVTYLEFRPDYRVEIRLADGQCRLIPFLDLPLGALPSDFFPLTCKTCVDYTNALSDITVGYMAGDGDQWLIVRNKKGQALANLIMPELVIKPLTEKGSRSAAVRGYLENTERAAGGLPLRRIPRLLRGFVSWMQRKFGPKGLEFARARVEMKAVETVLHLRFTRPGAMRRMIPDHVWTVAESVGLEPEAGEKS